MEIKRVDYEVVKVETTTGIQLTLTEDEAAVLLASLGKAHNEDVRNFINSTFRDSVLANRASDIAYKLYIDLYDDLDHY